MTITLQPALAPSPQPRPAPSARALPPKPVAQGGQNWTPIRGQNWAPIDKLNRWSWVGLLGVGHRSTPCVHTLRVRRLLTDTFRTPRPNATGEKLCRPP